jgi:hypothetical protein
MRDISNSFGVVSTELKIRREFVGVHEIADGTLIFLVLSIIRI